MEGYGKKGALVTLMRSSKADLKLFVAILIWRREGGSERGQESQRRKAEAEKREKIGGWKRTVNDEGCSDSFAMESSVLKRFMQFWFVWFECKSFD